MNIQKNQSILITGGTGSFGKAFIKKIIESKIKPKRLVIYSRDELKQSEMAQMYTKNKYPFIRYFLGDVRDQKRLQSAMQKIDIVVHAAALKQVVATEYNPFEAVKTNIIGAQNLIESAISTGVKRVIALSTDKAAAPVNLYGATKLCSDKLFISANNIVGKRDLKFSVVRYGNVFGSRGSVVPFFLNKKHEGVLPITDPNMTRFNITLKEGVDLVLWSIKNAMGGEIFVPKLSSYKITDVASAVGPTCKQKIIGIRPGEKIHEEMITTSDSQNTIELENIYIILPSMENKYLAYYKRRFKAKGVKSDFVYKSNSTKKFLTVGELKKILKDYEKK
jgi:UDP-N-acetylglucosamine 4,6-dehydratase/5-epimerase